MKTKYLTIRISEDEKRRIKADAVKAKLSLTEYVLGKLNVPTIVPTDLTVLVDSPDVPTKQGATIETHTENEHTIVEVMKDNTELDTPTIEHLVKAGKEAKPDNVITTTHPCAICEAKIKKGFLCKTCASTK